MTPQIDDAIWSILEQKVPMGVQSLPTDSVTAIIADIREGRTPQPDAASGGFGFGSALLVEQVVLGVHVALALVHSVMLLKHHHSEREMVTRLRRIAAALDEKLELTDALIDKLNVIDPS